MSAESSFLHRTEGRNPNPQYLQSQSVSPQSTLVLVWYSPSCVSVSLFYKDACHIGEESLFSYDSNLTWWCLYLGRLCFHTRMHSWVPTVRSSRILLGGRSHKTINRGLNESLWFGRWNGKHPQSVPSASSCAISRPWLSVVTKWDAKSASSTTVLTTPLYSRTDATRALCSGNFPLSFRLMARSAFPFYLGERYLMIN